MSTDPGDHRAELRGQLADVDWDAARVESRPVDPAQVSLDATEDHAHGTDEPTVVEDGDALDELTETGEPDQGLFGDGAYAPAHWWGA